VLPELFKKSKFLLPGLVFATLIAAAVHCILEAFEVLLDFSSGDFLVVRPSLMVFYLSWVLGVSSLIYWTFLTWKSMRQISTFTLSQEEYQELIYSTTLAFATLSAFLLNYFCKATTWPNASEKLLVGYVFIQLGASVFLTGGLYLKLLAYLLEYLIDSSKPSFAGTCH
jgi:hypothetical protein